MNKSERIERAKFAAYWWLKYQDIEKAADRYDKQYGTHYRNQTLWRISHFIVVAELTAKKECPGWLEQTKKELYPKREEA